ncbi:MAG TPA: dipeptidase [Candidatus Limnocylindrales bacterium]|nr:dipeptidase [Candidatus Limnocylindrales bacterium]
MKTLEAVVGHDLEAHLDASREARHTSYLELLRIPSISTLPEHAPDCQRCAEWIAADLERVGFEHVEVSPTGGHPIVYADWLHAAGAPTILVYCHYDVQPVDPIELWETAPFEPFIDGNRVVGRGAADDKGQLHMHVRAAEAILATRGALPVNLRVIFEGEEESTSVHLGSWIEANRERLAADAIVISDTGFFEGNRPALNTGLRGLLYTQIDVVGPAQDLHSGGFGGLVENPANALARIIAELKDRHGVVQIPHFYDDVEKLTPSTRAELAAMAFDEEAVRAQCDVPMLVGEAGYEPLERLGYRPTLDVNGIWGGFTGEGSKTIIPAHAHAKVSCRLVPNQDPAKILENLTAFVESVTPPGVTVTVHELGMGRALVVKADDPVAKAALDALEATFGQKPFLTRGGGSIPVAELFATLLHKPPVMLGFTNPDDHAHAPNEYMRLDNYETGIRTICRLWDTLGGWQP